MLRAPQLKKTKNQRSSEGLRLGTTQSQRISDRQYGASSGIPHHSSQQQQLGIPQAPMLQSQQMLGMNWPQHSSQKQLATPQVLNRLMMKLQMRISS